MISKKMTVNITADPEERPVAMLVQIASQFESKIYLESQDKKINAKSIMGMMSMGLESGAEVLVTADGVDEENAVAEIEKFLTTR